MAGNLIMTEDGTVKPAAAYTLIAAIVLGGAFFLYSTLRGGQNVKPVTMMCWTPGCGYEQTEKPVPGTIIPAKCPKCGKESLAPCFICPSCGTKAVWNCYRGIQETDRCPQCKTEVRYGQ